MVANRMEFPTFIGMEQRRKQQADPFSGNIKVLADPRRKFIVPGNDHVGAAEEAFVCAR